MSLKWKKANIKTKLSWKALQGGEDLEKSPIYVGRAHYNGLCLPANIIPSKNICYLSFNGDMVFVENFEVLYATKGLQWVPAKGGAPPYDALHTYTDKNGLSIFIGRAIFEGSRIIGRISLYDRCLYIPYNGKEIRINNYEGLVYAEPNQSFVNGFMNIVNGAAGPYYQP